MELRVLGPLEAHGPAGPVRLRPLERRLLAALVAARPDGVTLDALAEALWGEAIPRSAGHTVQTHVRRARQVLDADTIVTVGSSYRLGGQVIVDSDEFEASLRAALTAPGNVGVGPWDVALRRWRGVPFVELADWLPAIGERARLTELAHTAREGRCAAAISTDPTGLTVAEAQRLVEDEPLREHRWVLLMDALAATGRRPEALRVFDRARRVLATELGISPGHQLSRRHRSLVELDVGSADDERVAVRPAAAPAWGSLPAPVSTLIGRDHLVVEVRVACAGSRLVTLTGVGGVGKSRTAVAAGRAAMPDHDGGVWFVALVAADCEEDIDTITALTLGIVGTDQRPLPDTLIAAIGSRHMLLILDNCEHLLDACAAFAAAALASCPGLHILATGRAALRLPGERVIAVDPLDVAPRSIPWQPWATPTPRSSSTQQPAPNRRSDRRPR